MTDNDVKALAERYHKVIGDIARLRRELRRAVKDINTPGSEIDPAYGRELEAALAHLKAFPLFLLPDELPWGDIPILSPAPPVPPPPVPEDQRTELGRSVTRMLQPPE